MDLPEWWDWELELIPHLFERMSDRGFNETELRLMLETPIAIRDDHEEGRYVIECLHKGRAWEVIVEPDAAEKVLIIVTGYPTG
jgi:hypothetical protein